MPNATNADPASQATRPVYRPFQRDQGSKGWIVTAAGPEVPGHGLAVLSGFKTEALAREAADTLNGLEPSGRGDEVLRRMLAKERSYKP